MASPATLNATGSWSMCAAIVNNTYAQTYIGEMTTGSNYIFKSAIKFSTLSNGTIPPTATITSAVLKIYAIGDYATYAGTISVYRLRRDTAATMTWTIAKTGLNWTTAGAGSTTNDIDSSNCGTLNTSASETLNEYKSITLTASTIQTMILGGSWTNNGFLLSTAGTDDGYQYQTYTDANPPKLVVIYTEGGAGAGAVYRTRRGIESPRPTRFFYFKNGLAQYV